MRSWSARVLMVLDIQTLTDWHTSCRSDITIRQSTDAMGAVMSEDTAGHSFWVTFPERLIGLVEHIDSISGHCVCDCAECTNPDGDICICSQCVENEKP